MEHDDLDPHTALLRPEAPAGNMREADIKAALAAHEMSVTNRRALNREIRRASKTPEFIGQCGLHGETLFDSKTGACLSCLCAAPADVPVRLAYKAAGAALYPAVCSYHGETLFVVQNLRCRECFAESVGDPARVSARREGRAHYDSICDIHDLGPHSVATGKCVACSPREPARAAARAAGAPTYLAVCEACGESPHYVTNGKCSGCFTTAGMERRGRTTNPARIEARARGLTSYQDVCDIHGSTAHHTIRGKCLSCFNSLGQPRKERP